MGEILYLQEKGQGKTSKNAVLGRDGTPYF